jgi:hypothetical protein
MREVRIISEVDYPVRGRADRAVAFAAALTEVRGIPMLPREMRELVGQVGTEDGFENATGETMDFPCRIRRSVR